MGNYELKITHLCVGLGLSVLIELQYGNLPQRFVGLLDCGSINGGDNFYGPALEKIAVAVANNNGVLNYVHISHFDADHFNKMDELGRKYKSNFKNKIKIEKMYFGCVGNKNVNKLKRTVIYNFEINENNIFIYLKNFYYNSGIPYVFPYGPENSLFVNIPLDTNLFFRICPLLYHGHLMPDKYQELNQIQLHDNSVLINTGSSILLVTIVGEAGGMIYPQFSYIFTGDATVETMKIMRHISLWFGYESKAIGIAHHGAKRHVADDEERNDYSTLIWFLRDLLHCPNAAIVSAKCKNQKGWTHPHIDTMGIYNQLISSSSPRIMPVTCFKWEGSQMKVCQSTTTKLLYETFKLNNQVVDGTVYKYCGSDKYLLYDIEMETTNQAPAQFWIREISR